VEKEKARKWKEVTKEGREKRKIEASGKRKPYR